MSSSFTTLCHYLIYIIIFTSFERIQSSRILGIFDICSRSHYSIHKTIMEGLLSRNHEVTEVSYFASNKTSPKYKGILIGEIVQSYVDSVTIEDTKKELGTWNYIRQGTQIETTTCQAIFNIEYIKELISRKEKTIDLLIAEAFHTQCYHLLAHTLDVPLVIIISTSTMMGVDYFAGNPHNPSYVPLLSCTFTTKMSFFQRLQNSIAYVFLYWYQIYVYNTDLQKIAQKHGIEFPSEDILNKRTALVMYNNHMSFIGRPKPPNAVNIAGTHIKPAKRLPKDLEDFIEESPQGVILFSLGSTIKASSISEDKMKIIQDSFSVIPQRVLWRVDQLNITHIPSNVKLVQWLPQRDILEHSNVVGFISHCGIFGTLEAIHTATPVIGIPFSFDQLQNANLLVEKGVGVHVDYDTMNRDVLISAIKEISSPKYHENMQQLSRIFKDGPVSPLDEALYWLEYVLKYQGAPHLRTQAADMPLYQYLLLDVILFLVVAILTTLYLFYFACKLITRSLCRSLCRAKSKNKTD